MDLPHRQITGHFDPDCEQAQWWKKLTGTLTVPLKSMLPVRGRDETGEVTEFYQINLPCLPPPVVDQLARFMAAKFRVDITEIKSGFQGDHGCPVRASLLRSVTQRGVFS